MDDMIKDMIPRKAVEYCLRKETVDTNPEAYKAHKKFIGYMDDPEISQFGHWMHANGYNCALTSIAVDLDKIPSAQPTEASCWGCSCPKMERLKEQKTFSEMIHLHDADELKVDCPNCGARMDGKNETD